MSSLELPLPSDEAEVDDALTEQEMMGDIDDAEAAAMAELAFEFGEGGAMDDLEDRFACLLSMIHREQEMMGDYLNNPNGWLSAYGGEHQKYVDELLGQSNMDPTEDSRMVGKHKFHDHCQLIAEKAGCRQNLATADCNEFMANVYVDIIKYDDQSRVIFGLGFALRERVYIPGSILRWIGQVEPLTKMKVPMCIAYSPEQPGRRTTPFRAKCAIDVWGDGGGVLENPDCPDGLDQEVVIQ